MHKNWKKVSLAELAKIIRRGISPKYCKDGLLVINQKCIRDQRLEVSKARHHDFSQRKVHEDLILQSGDVLVNSTGVGTLGRIAQVNKITESTTIDSHVTLIRADPHRVDISYFGWAIRGKQSLIENLGEGSTGQIELSRNKLAQVELCIPPVKEQKAIAEILSSIDDKIELNRKMNETLEEMAQTLFKSWFIDFDPVHAKAKGQKPRGISEKIAALFPDSFQESKLGMIPKGWNVCEISQHIKFLKGKKGKRSSNASAVPLIAISVFDGQDSEMVSREKMNISEANNILMVMDGASSGRVETGHYGAIGSTLAKIETGKEFERYIYCFLKSKETTIKAQTTGTSIPHADKQLIGSFLMCNPSKGLLKIFDEHADSILKKIIHNKSEIKSLINTRDILLPKLLSGEISVKEAEKQIQSKRTA